MNSERIFILKTVKYGESDLIVQGLDIQGGKLSLFAKGGRKSVKRFGGGVLEPTHFVEVQYDKKRRESQELCRLAEARLVKGFPGLRSDYERLEVALKILALLERVSFEGMTDGQNIYNLLGNTLAALESSENLRLLWLHFLVRFLKYQGVLPSDGWTQQFLSLPLKDHDQIDLSEELVSSIESVANDLVDKLF